MPNAVTTLVALGTLLLAGPQLGLRFAPQPLTAASIQEWADAVDAHEPGKVDEALEKINRWSADNLYVLFSELRALEAFQNNPLVRRSPVNAVRYPSPEFEKSISLLVRLTPEERRTGNINRLLLRAALLHTDVQLLATPAANAIIINRASPFSGLLLETAQDGRRMSTTNSASHTEFASWLLDGVKRDESTDAIVRMWYVTAAAHLVYSQRNSDAGFLLMRGRRLYPDDMVLQFLSGAIHETMATPRVQAGFRQPGVFNQMLSTDHHRDSLKQAQTYFTKALDIYPGYLEARLHLGRVTGLLGDHVQAIDLLTAVAAKATLNEHRYYTALFLAREQDAAGNLTAARQQLERASAVFPQAQSPLLALSELARRQGDSAGARQPLEKLLALPPSDERDDPFWWYYLHHVVDAPARLQQWRELAIASSR